MIELQIIGILKSIKVAVYFMPLGFIFLLACLVVMGDRVMRLMVEIILKLELLKEEMKK